MTVQLRGGSAVQARGRPELLGGRRGRKAAGSAVLGARGDDPHRGESQPLAFPRAGVYFDTKLGFAVVLDAVAVPDRIVRATFDQAYHMLNNDGLLDDTGSVTDLNISSISLSSVIAPNLISKGVKRLINPLLASAGSTMWWRAN